MFILYGYVLFGGIVIWEVYELLVNKSLEMLVENGFYDGFFFDIYGVMSVEGLDDLENDFF